MSIYQCVVLAMLVGLLAWSANLGIRMARECAPCACGGAPR